MAITFPLTATTNVVSNGGAGSYTIAVNKPTSLADNDVLLVVVGFDFASANTCTWAADSGWVEITGASNDSINSGQHEAHFYKVISNAAGEAASYTFTTTISVSGGDLAIVCTAARGVDINTPIHVVAATIANGTASSWNAPDLTTTVANAMYISGGVQDRDPTITFGGGQTKIAQASSANSTAGSRVTVYLGYEEIVSAGAVGTAQAISSTQSRTFNTGAYSLTPAAVGEAEALAGNLNASSDLDGTLTATVPLTASASASSDLDGTLTATVPLTASASAASDLDGTLTATVPVVATASASSDLDGTLVVTRGLAGNVVAAADMSATALLNLVAIAGTLSAATTFADAQLAASVTLNGTIVAAATLDVLADIERGLAGTLTAAASMTAGDMTLLRQLAGTLNAAADMSGVLRLPQRRRSVLTAVNARDASDVTTAATVDAGVTTATTI